LLAVIKHVVDDNIICLSATQLMHAPVHSVCNTVQQLLRKMLNFISPELWLNRPELKSVDYKLEILPFSTAISSTIYNRSWQLTTDS